MKKTFVDVLLELPVDNTLQNFLAANGLPLPDDLSWSDGQEVTRTVIEAIRTWPDEIARDALIAKLMASVALGDAAGKQAMFQVARQDGVALMGLVSNQSDIHRSFWLYVNYPALFDLAGDVDFFERHGSQAQQNELGVKRKPDTSEAALLGMRQAISAFYQRELQCGDGSVAYVLERSPDVYLLTELIAEAFPSENPLKRNWQINSAHINLYYPPQPGKMRSKVITIEITRKGRLNLHKFDAKMQAQLEGYLVTLGILDAGQTLSANEQQPGEDAFQSEPAFQE